MLTEEEQRELVRVAKQSIETAMRRRHSIRSASSSSPREAPGGPPRTSLRGRLSNPGGAFVTLRIGGELRGCIGYIESPLPLAQTVEEVAEKAAFEDPRFPPLTPGELPGVRLEISVLSPLQRIKDVAEIQVGVHGILLALGRCRGLLLPQVATEYGWDRETFLESTSRKAGLAGDAWKNPAAEMYIFTAEIVEEHHG